MSTEAKLVYGLNNPEEFEDAKKKLEASDAADLLKKIATVLPDTGFSYRKEQGKGWPQYKVEGPKTPEDPDYLNSVYTSEFINSGSLTITYGTLAPERICIEVTNGWAEFDHKKQQVGGASSRDWKMDLPADVERDELAQAIFNGIQRITNFDTERLEEVRTALGLNPQEPQS